MHTWPARHPLADLLFVHGARPRSARFERLAHALTARRINVSGVQPRGRGPVTLHGLAEALGVLSDRARLPLILGGYSLGGTAAALAACADDNRLAGLLLVATPITARPLEPGGLDLGDLDAGRRRAQSERVAPRTPRSAWDLLADRFPVLGLPVMFVHGMGDTIVPARENHAWAARLKHADFIGFHGARHDVLNAPGHRRVATTIADFVLAAALDAAA
ncbi:alpha/beta hydrolase [Actinomadura viridis]|uniref:Pimeloyl-ACP methyl ester carboxylesterase n=1 Tax=Actinomadura viridis TaxID=58110 RepID=A0A931GLW3_9ACTN|nr:alpha/beta fold hydrolase [Actinomadura viridis]MBG6091460.1 pimeloyl-ACP methyl ester carboxylesterase [Actinomadura viridis]